MSLHNNSKEITTKMAFREKATKKDFVNNYEAIVLNQFYQKLASKSNQKRHSNFLDSLYQKTQIKQKQEKSVQLDAIENQFSDSLIQPKGIKLPNLQARHKNSFNQKILVNETIYIHERMPIKNAQHAYLTKKYSVQQGLDYKVHSHYKYASKSSKKIVDLQVIDINDIKNKSHQSHESHGQIFSPRNEMMRHRSNQKIINKKANSKAYQYPVQDNKMLKVQADSLKTNKSSFKQIYHQKTRIQKLIEQYKAIKHNTTRHDLSITDKNMLTQLMDMQKIKVEGQQTIYFQKKDAKKGKKQEVLTYKPKIRFVNWKTKELPFTDITKSQVHRLFLAYLNTKEVVPAPSGHYKVYVGEGNNGQLISRLLKNRGWWATTEDINEANLIWTQLPFEDEMKKLPTHQHIQLCPNSKDYLLSSNAQEDNKRISNFLKYKYSSFFSACEKILYLPVYRKYMLQFIAKFKENLYLKSYSSPKEIISKFYQSKQLLKVESKFLKIINHCQNSNQIGDKKQLFYHIGRYCEINMVDKQTMIPKTVHINQIQIQQLKISNNEEKIQQHLVLFDQQDALYILKPGQSSNRGNGITVHPSKTSLIQYISQSLITFPENKTYIVQSYIDPLLYEGRKFDIRVWALYANNRVWFYRQGYVRTSCKEYTIKNMNKFVHLTNDAIQKYSDEYGKYQPANKVSFNQLDKYLKKSCNYQNFYPQIYKNIKNLTKTLFEVGNTMIGRSCHQFQLFGLDFLIDKDFKVWLIQCNTNPSIEICCSLLNRLVPNMIENLLSIVVDPLFPAVERKAVKEDYEWNTERFNFELLLDGVLQTSYIQTIASTNKDYLSELSQINSHKLESYLKAEHQPSP